MPRNLKRKALPLRYRWSLFGGVSVVPAATHVSESILDQVASPVHMSMVSDSVSDDASVSDCVSPSTHGVDHVSVDMVSIPDPDPSQFIVAAAASVHCW